MDKELLRPLSGFRDYSRPTKDRLIFQLRQIFVKYGYQPLETPSIERQDLLLKNYGEEAQKLLYLFEDNGKRKVGLRYDLTLPLARFYAANYQVLPTPYKRFEIGSVWRAERPQKGRLRQFTQADIDIVGTASLAAEKEMLSVVAEVERVAGLNFEVQLNDRAVVATVFDKLKIPNRSRQKLLQILDKKDKIAEQVIFEGILKLGISDVQLRQIRSIFLESETLDDVARLAGEGLTAPVVELIETARRLGLKAAFVPSMVRGLDYYTSTIIECRVDGYPSSVAGGGRYDNLVEGLIGQKVPAVGLSFGVDRLVELLDERQLEEPAIFVARLPETSSELDLWAEDLRKVGCNVEVFLDETVELGKQIRYADKRGYQEILIPRLEDWRQNKIVKKNLQTGQQQSIPREEVKNVKA